jgi:accessory gene regulator protein AgrB
MVKNDPKITKIGKIENRRKKRKIMHMFERILMIIISLYIYKTILGILVLSSVVEHL